MAAAVASQKRAVEEAMMGHSHRIGELMAQGKDGSYTDESLVDMVAALRRNIFDNLCSLSKITLGLDAAEESRSPPHPAAHANADARPPPTAYHSDSDSGDAAEGSAPQDASSAAPARAADTTAALPPSAAADEAAGHELAASRRGLPPPVPPARGKRDTPAQLTAQAGGLRASGLPPPAYADAAVDNAAGEHVDAGQEAAEEHDGSDRYAEMGRFAMVQILRARGVDMDDPKDEAKVRAELRLSDNIIIAKGGDPQAMMKYEKMPEKRLRLLCESRGLTPNDAFDAFTDGKPQYIEFLVADDKRLEAHYAGTPTSDLALRAQQLKLTGAETTKREALIVQLVHADIDAIQIKIKGDKKRAEAELELEECLARGKLVSKALTNDAFKNVWATWDVEREPSSSRYSSDGGEGAAVEALLGADVGMPPHVRQVVAAPEVTAQNDGEMVTPIITPAGKPRSNAVCPHCDVELPHVPCKHKDERKIRLRFTDDVTAGLGACTEARQTKAFKVPFIVRTNYLEHKGEPGYLSVVEDEIVFVWNEDGRDGPLGRPGPDGRLWLHGWVPSGLPENDDVDSTREKWGAGDAGDDDEDGEDVEMGIFPADIVRVPDKEILDELNLFDNGTTGVAEADDFGDLADLLGDEGDMMVIGQEHSDDEFASFDC